MEAIRDTKTQYEKKDQLLKLIYRMEGRSRKKVETVTQKKKLKKPGKSTVTKSSVKKECQEECRGCKENKEVS